MYQGHFLKLWSAKTYQMMLMQCFCCFFFLLIFFIKSYVVDTHWNCISFVDAVPMGTQNIWFYKVDAVPMGTHNIWFYKEVNKKTKLTVICMNTTELLDCALIGVCAVIRSNMVLHFAALRFWCRNKKTITVNVLKFRMPRFLTKWHIQAVQTQIKLLLILCWSIKLPSRHTTLKQHWFNIDSTLNLHCFNLCACWVGDLLAWHICQTLSQKFFEWWHPLLMYVNHKKILQQKWFLFQSFPKGV